MIEENEIKFNTTNFSFSGTSINSLQASEYSLCTICLDASVSISSFRKKMENVVKQVIESCQKSVRSDNLMVQILTFDVGVKEFQGFKELNKCVLSSYDGMLDHLGGRTALYDAIYDGVVSLKKYSEELDKEDFLSNGVIYVISDGLENNSTNSLNSLKEVLKTAVAEGGLESLQKVLIGVNTAESGVASALKQLADELSFEYIDVANADSKNLAKLAKFISKSLSSTSSALGTGTTAPSLSF